MNDILVFTVVILLAALIIFVVAVATLRILQAYAYRKFQLQLEREREAEVARLNALPKLRTDCLLRVPIADNPSNARTFGDRWNRLIIWDEYGKAWVGFKCPDVITDLVNGEYLPENYWVPFCGPGEMIASKVVEVEDRIFTIYPTYLKDKPIDGPDWQEWLMIVKRCSSRAYKEYHELIPYELQKKIRDRRSHYGVTALVGV